MEEETIPVITINKIEEENLSTTHKIEDDEDDSSYCASATRYIFSHLCLFILLSSYCVGGAFIFAKIEEADEEKKLEMDFSRTVKQLLEEYHKNVTAAIMNYGYKGKRINSKQDFTYGWSFLGALLYAVTMVTPICYGHSAAPSEVGQVVSIIYSLIGFPFTLMFLANIGDMMAMFVRLMYSKDYTFFCGKLICRSFKANPEQQEQINSKEEQKEKGSGIDSDDEKDNYTISNSDIEKQPMEEECELKDNCIDSTNLQEQIQSAEEESKIRRGTIQSTKSKSMDTAGGTDDVMKTKNNLEQTQNISDEDIDETFEEEVIYVPVSFSLTIITIYVFIGAVMFAQWKNWTWITGAYYSFATISMIGFGDMIQWHEEVGTTEGTVMLAISSFYFIFGLVILSMCFNLMMEEVIAKFVWLGRQVGIIDDEPLEVNDQLLPDDICDELK